MSKELAPIRSSLPALVRESKLDLGPARNHVLRAMDARQIRDYDAETYVSKIKGFLPYLWKDIGIRGTPTDYDFVRTADWLRQYFPEFTFEEVKQAFEYLLAGLLEDYLPEDPNHSKHFGEWNVGYLSKILRAYRVLRSRTVIDVKRMLPDPNDRPMTEEEKQKIRKDFVVYLLEKMIECKRGKSFPRHLASSFVHRTLIDIGLTSYLPEPSPEDVRRSLSFLLSDETIPPTTRSDIRRRHEEGRIDSFLSVRTTNDLAARAIIEVIETTTEEDLLKKLNDLCTSSQ